MLPELLPFVVQNERFFDHAIKHSAGGLSPRVKFKDLANYKFLLPPKKQQIILSELLWAIDNVVEKNKILFQKHETTRASLLKKIFAEGEKTVRLDEIFKLASGKTRPKDLAEIPDGKYVYPVYGGNGIIGYSEDNNVPHPTIILGRVGEYCGVVHDSHGPSWVSDNALYIKEWKCSVDKLFVSRFLEFLDLNKKQTGGGQPLITQPLVYKNEISLPPVEEIQKCIDKIKILEATGRNIQEQGARLMQLMKSLINQVF